MLVTTLTAFSCCQELPTEVFCSRRCSRLWWIPAKSCRKFSGKSLKSASGQPSKETQQKSFTLFLLAITSPHSVFHDCLSLAAFPHSHQVSIRCTCLLKTNNWKLFVCCSQGLTFQLTKRLIAIPQEEQALVLNNSD